MLKLLNAKGNLWFIYLPSVCHGQCASLYDFFAGLVLLLYVFMVPGDVCISRGACWKLCAMGHEPLLLFGLFV